MSTAPAGRLTGEIESPRPLRAPGGQVVVSGWCLRAGQAEPPPLRVATEAGMLAGSTGLPRRDVPQLLPGEPAASCCGFAIEGTLPPGVHLARLEARQPDGGWELFRAFTVVVGAPPFAAAVEVPPGPGPLRQRVQVEGWALDPRQPVRALELRYGHQSIPCLTNRPRPDLEPLHPQSPHAGRAGFKSKTILSAGRGALRLKALLADGSVAIARTNLEVDIAVDENHPPGFDFGAARIDLPRSATRPPAGPAEASTKPARILFILPGTFSSNSALHVAALANELAATGNSCVATVPQEPETLHQHFLPAFRGVTHDEAARGRAVFDGAAPDVIHAWTSRENVRRLAVDLKQRTGARLVVHLEDNEHELLALTLQRPFREIAALGDEELARILPPDLSHPRRSREFLAQADGITIVTERLREFVPAAKPSLLITPGADARFFYPRPVPTAFRELLDLAEDTTVLFYHGNVHAANATEVRELYAAVLQLNRAGQPVTLIRTGLDRLDFLGELAGPVAPHVLALGQILHHHHLPPLMALADVFVQPGEPDAFNDYRFPSKLPEFFALGRPVVLPRTNLGLQVRHGIDAYVLDRADAAGIARAVTELRGNVDLRTRLGHGAAGFAARHFDWRRNAAALAKFYASLPA